MYLKVMLIIWVIICFYVVVEIYACLEYEVISCWKLFDGVIQTFLWIVYVGNIQTFLWIMFDVVIWTLLWMILEGVIQTFALMFEGFIRTFPWNYVQRCHPNIFLVLVLWICVWCLFMSWFPLIWSCWMTFTHRCISWYLYLLL